MTDRVNVWCAPDGTAVHWMVRGHLSNRTYGTACSWPRVAPTVGYRTTRRKAGLYLVCPHCHLLWNQWLNDPVYVSKELFSDRHPLA